MPDDLPPTNWPAGWYSDPWGTGNQRYWDGHEWTDQSIDMANRDARAVGYGCVPRGRLVRRAGERTTRTSCHPHRRRRRRRHNRADLRSRSSPARRDARSLICAATCRIRSPPRTRRGGGVRSRACTGSADATSCIGATWQSPSTARPGVAARRSAPNSSIRPGTGP
jgi:hypothetical protein